MRQQRMERPPLVHDDNLRRYLDRLIDAVNTLDSDMSDVAITSSYTPLAGHMFIYANASGSTISVHLPSNSTDEGAQYWIKKTDSSANQVVLVGTVDGSANPSINTQYISLTVRRFNGAYWIV